MRVYWALLRATISASFGPALLLLGLCILVLAFVLQLSSFWYWCGGLAFAIGFFRVPQSQVSSDEGYHDGDDFGGGSDSCD